MPVFIILALGGLVRLARSFTAHDGSGSAGTTLALGFLLLAAYFAGGLAQRLRLPKLTGYLATGIVVGPGVLGLVSEAALEQLSIASGAAVALIALTAGTELELRAMRPLFRVIGWLTVVAVGGTTALLAAAAFAARPWLGFLAAMPPWHAAAVACVIGVVMVAQSPAVVVALRDELDADGPVARTVLGVVVLADLFVIVLFAATTAGVKAVLGGGADVRGALATLGWEIGGSLVAGALIGLVLVLYLRKVRGSAALFVLTVCFVVAEVGRRIHLDPLLVALAAGVLIRNTTDVGDRLHDGIEQAALPVYVVFFTVAGAMIHLDVLAVVGAPAVMFVVVRGVGFLAGTRVGAWLAGADPAVGRFAGFGLMPQAGLALALSMLFARTFPEFGAQARALMLAVVALNEVFAPALYRAALVRSGEAGKGVAIDLGDVPTSAPDAPGG